MLHIIADSPFTHNSLRRCLNYINNDDTIVLMGDAVIAASVTSYQVLLQSYQVKVLDDDLAARGLKSKFGQTIDHQAFVRLVVDLGSPIRW